MDEDENEDNDDDDDADGGLVPDVISIFSFFAKINMKTRAEM